MPANPNPCRCSRVSLCPACYREQELADAERLMREVLRTFGTRPSPRLAPTVRTRAAARHLRLVPRPAGLA